jgi:mRNA interferase RelE/StbE
VKTLSWTKPAGADMRRLDPQVRRMLSLALERFAATEHGDVKRLQGEPGVYRLRVGDWRVRFELEPPGAVTVLRVQHRSQSYR